MSEPLSSSASTPAHLFDHEGRRSLGFVARFDGDNFVEATCFIAGSIVGSFDNAFDFFGDLSPGELLWKDFLRTVVGGVGDTKQSNLSNATNQKVKRFTQPCTCNKWCSIS